MQPRNVWFSVSILSLHKTHQDDVTSLVKIFPRPDGQKKTLKLFRVFGFPNQVTKHGRKSGLSTNERAIGDFIEKHPEASISHLLLSTSKDRVGNHQSSRKFTQYSSS